MQRIEAGYIAWRGTVSENIASHETKKVSGNLLSIYQRPGTQTFTHAYLYPLPSVRKQQPIVRQVHNPSQRRCPHNPDHAIQTGPGTATNDAASPEFSELTTGSQRPQTGLRFVVPAPKIRPRVWTRQKAYMEWDWKNFHATVQILGV